MVNSANMTIGRGRLTDDPKVFPNSDGSKKIRFTLAEQDNYKGKDGKRGSQFIPYEAFIGAGKSEGVYADMHKGDMVEVIATAKNNNYTPEGKEPVYGIIFQVETVTLCESKTVTDNRQAARVAAAADAEATA